MFPTQKQQQELNAKRQQGVINHTKVHNLHHHQPGGGALPFYQASPAAGAVTIASVPHITKPPVLLEQHRDNIEVNLKLELKSMFPYQTVQNMFT